MSSSPLSSSKPILVSALMFRSVICAQLVFLYGIRCRSNLTLLQVHNVPNTMRWKDCLSPTEWFWHSTHKSFGHICDGFLGRFYSIPLVSMSVFLPAPHCFNYDELVIGFDIRNYEISYFVVFYYYYFQKLFWLLRVPWVFPYKST